MLRQQWLGKKTWSLVLLKHEKALDIIIVEYTTDSHYGEKVQYFNGKY